ncbi:hypothetical protein [Viridibacterium curvum]|uniref:Uncharacterized protein n=1 Tax=Viridibacterium curvum TaxID=1101404 RepID=A0ABP9QTB8_9RHOO
MPSLSVLALSSRSRHANRAAAWPGFRAARPAAQPGVCPAVPIRSAPAVRPTPSRRGWKLLSLLAGMLLMALATLAGHALRPLGSESQRHSANSLQLEVVDTAGARAFRIQPEQALLVSLNLRHGLSELARIHDEALREAQGLRFDAATQQLHVLTPNGWRRYDARRLQRVADSAPGTSLGDAADVSNVTRKPLIP